MSQGLQKKICGVLAVLLAFAILTVPSARAVSVSFDDIVAASMDIIQQSEGAYDSVSANDNGALSIGCIQWHGNRALSLLQTIVQANPAQAKNILGGALYNEITTTSSSGWTTRILNKDEAAKIKALLGTAESRQAQDNLILADVSTYVSRSMGYGITSPSALVYLADVENQCGAGGARRVINAAAALVGGDYSAIKLDVAHKAALSDGPAGSFSTRRNKVYNYVLGLGWDTQSLTDGCEIWKVQTGTTLNVRSGPGADKHPVVSSVSGGTVMFITEKVMVNGSTWGESNLGWLHLGYCDYISGSIPSRVYFDAAGGSFASARTTQTITNYNDGRPANALSIYTYTAHGSSTGSNIYGSEAAVDASGRVLSVEGYGNGDIDIPKGGFAVSGNGTMSTWISANIKVGDYVFADPVSMKLSVFNSYEACMAQGKQVTKDQKIGALPTPTREGYVFEGWYTSAGGGTRVNTDTAYTERICTTLYAHWRELQSGAVVYKLDGGTLDGAVQHKLDGVDIDRDQDFLVVFTKGAATGTNAYGSEAVVEADGRVSAVTPYGVGNSTIPEGGFVLSGHNTMSSWITGNVKVGDYITYDGSAGTVTVCSSADVYAVLAKQVREGDPVGALPAASREHYTFTGWYTEQGARATEKTVVPIGGLTLTAGWEKISATVTLDPGKGSLEKVAKAETVAAGVNTDRNENTLIIFTPAYGSSTGTNVHGIECVVDATGKVIAAPGYGVGDTQIPAGCIVLSGHGEGAWWLQGNVSLGDYVVVDTKTLSVSVYTSAEYHKTNTVQVYHGDPVGNLPVPVWTDMDFIGWYTEKGVQITADTISDFSGSVTLYARYVNSFNCLTFETGIGTGGPTPVKFKDGESVTIPNTVPDGGCYAFLGWSNEADNNVIYQPGDTYTGGSAVLYAVYDMEHGYTETCNTVYTGLDENGDCLYTYTCEQCGFTGTFAVAAKDALTQSSIYETVNGDYLTAYISFEETVLLSDYTYLLQYDPTLLTFHSKSTNISGVQVETYEADGIGYVRMQFSEAIVRRAGYIKLFFTGASGGEAQEHYVAVAQQSGTLADKIPGAFHVSGHTTVTGTSVLGDVDGDGVLTMADAVILCRAVVGNASAPYADINGDGILTSVDVVYQWYILGNRIREVYEIP